VPLLKSAPFRVAAVSLALVGLIFREPWIVILGAVILVLSLAAGWWQRAGS
jgi:hypothetical protein